MIIKLEGITIEQLNGLYLFLENQEPVSSPDIHAKKPKSEPFARIMDCKIPQGEGGKTTPTFHLTLEVKERECAENPSDKNPEGDHLPVPLTQLAKLMQSLGLFPDDFYDKLTESVIPAAERGGVRPDRY